MAGKGRKRIAHIGHCIFNLFSHLIAGALRATELAEGVDRAATGFIQARDRVPRLLSCVPHVTESAAAVQGRPIGRDMQLQSSRFLAGTNHHSSRPSRRLVPPANQPPPQTNPPLLLAQAPPPPRCVHPLPGAFSLAEAAGIFLKADLFCGSIWLSGKIEMLVRTKSYEPQHYLFTAAAR